MIRLAVQIALAIHQINPLLSVHTSRSYAAAFVAASKRNGIDPWLLVEVVHRETRWIPTLVRHEHNGSCSVGLGQVNGSCEASFVLPLLGARRNLRRSARILGQLRSHCTSDCAAMAWLRGYNPGSPSYAPTILEAVRRRHE